MTSTPSLPALPDDVILRILISLKPDDPAGLARASLACKHWRSILTDAGFLRRYRESHRTPPRLGLIHNELSYRYSHVALFIPTCSFRPAAPKRRGLCIAVRHGRVLLQTVHSTELVVWDPVTDKRWELPPGPWSMNFNAMVLCAAPGCDHLDCHGRPFAVALVGGKLASDTTCAYLYSSETGEWSEQAELEDFFLMDPLPGVLVGDAVYFTCKSAVIDGLPQIAKYDMGRGELSLIDLPPLHHVQPDTMLMWTDDDTMLTATHDGQLRFVDVDGSTLRLWSREADGWSTVRRVVEPETAPGPAPVRLHVKGFAPCAGEIFVDAGGVLYSVELESGRASKPEPEEPFPSLAGPLKKFTPYESFYTPDRATPTPSPPCSSKPGRIIPGFLRELHHRTAAPMLGLLHNASDESYSIQFVPTSSFRPADVEVERGGCCCIAARHGRVLLEAVPYDGRLVVWDPVTDEKWAVPPAPSLFSRFCFNAMVLCAASGCDHLDCHGGPFAVALVGSTKASPTFAYLYSSETGEWSEQAEFEDGLPIDKRAGVLVGDAVYFTCRPYLSPWIVKYDMGRGELSLIDVPPPHRHEDQPGNVRILSVDGTMMMATDDGMLGFAGWDGSTSRLCLWYRGPDGWTRRRVVEMDYCRVIGFAAGAGVIYLNAGPGAEVVLSVEVESGRLRTTSIPSSFADGRVPVLTPYESFDRTTPP